VVLALQFDFGICQVFVPKRKQFFQSFLILLEFLDPASLFQVFNALSFLLVFQLLEHVVQVYFQLLFDLQGQPPNLP
jgi:hypothetical protein